ncbi:MAG: preprotein translocase subunit SecG, partial [Verrucomicrobiota bacterium]
IVLILMQQSKGGGGLGAIGGDATGSVFGAGAGNVMTKATTILAACFLAITLALAVIAGRRSEGESVLESAVYEEEQQQEAQL